MGAGRKFRSRNKNPNGLDGNHGVTTLYRYEEQFKAPQAALKLFANIPFLNGGLFECLDKSEEKLYIDGFSDNPKNQPSLPDDLFFGPERPVDLSAAYGDTRHSHENVRGLIPIFNDYKFTIEENTPIEEEVALDPELLGKVFENLLAAYNPETGTTARKQTGSFYTPREIVNYMVDEALIAYLESALILPSPSSGEWLGMREKLRHLFAYNDQTPLFNEAEILKLIEAVNNLKALDPACGSGAFPMGLLHKLVFILKKLDPDNTLWREFQLAKVADFPELVTQVEASFKNNHDDYGRKLYLIQNCIYGVDIQPIAVQIAKLRVFISLVVEQKMDDSQPNRGILPLPNLETKFIAANTLIGINRPGTKPVDEAPTPISPELEKNCKQLLDMLRQYLIVSNPETKARYLAGAKGLGEEINTALENDASFQPLNIDKIFSTAKDTAALKALLPINREAEASMLVLRNLDIDEKEKQLAEARKRYFSARTPETKAKYRQKDKELRDELANLLKKDGWGSETAQQLAGWDPYNQNAHAEFFDFEWMFGIAGGFDVVIGNPPYVRVHKQDAEQKEIYRRIYISAKGDFDIYVLFIECALRLLSKNGILVFITPDKYLIRDYGDELRRLILNKYSIVELYDISRSVDAFAAAVYPLISTFRRTTKKEETRVRFARSIKEIYLPADEYSVAQQNWLESNIIELVPTQFQFLLNKIFATSITLRELIGSENIFCGTPRAKDYYTWSNGITSKESKETPKLLVCANLQPFKINHDKEVRTLGEKVYKPFFDNSKGLIGQNLWHSFLHIPKILIRGNDKRVTAVLDETPSVFIGVYAIKLVEPFLQYANYLTACLNSNLYQWIFQRKNPSLKIGGEYFSINAPQILALPIRIPDEKLLNKINETTNQINRLKRTNSVVDTSALEQEIDQLIYELYGLTDEEKKVVETS